MTRHAKRAAAGFTLIEILLSILLMMILLLAVTMIFMNTTETVAVSEARSLVYTNARYALDFLQKDLFCRPIGHPEQTVFCPWPTGKNSWLSE